MSINNACRFFLASFLLGLLPFSQSWGGEYNAAVQARLISKSEVTGNGGKIRYPVSSQPEVSAYEVDFSVGAETGWHKHPVPVYAYVVAGRLQVELEGGKLLNFKPGDAIIEVVDAWHNGRNIGCEPVRLAVFYLGSKEVGNVVKSPKNLSVSPPPPVRECPEGAPQR